MSEKKHEITFKLNSLAGLMCLLLCATGFCGVCISHCTIEVQKYLVPPFFGPGRTKVVLLVVLGGAVRGSVLGFGVVVAEQYWVTLCAIIFKHKSISSCGEFSLDFRT